MKSRYRHGFFLSIKAKNGEWLRIFFDAYTHSSQRINFGKNTVPFYPIPCCPITGSIHAAEPGKATPSSPTTPNRGKSSLPREGTTSRACVGIKSLQTKKIMEIRWYPGFYLMSGKQRNTGTGNAAPPRVCTCFRACIGRA